MVKQNSQNDVCDTLGTNKTICESRTESKQIWVCKTIK